MYIFIRIVLNILPFILFKIHLFIDIISNIDIHLTVFLINLRIIYILKISTQYNNVLIIISIVIDLCLI